METKRTILEILDLVSCQSSLGRAAGVDIRMQAGRPKKWMGGRRIAGLGLKRALFLGGACGEMLVMQVSGRVQCGGKAAFSPLSPHFAYTPSPSSQLVVLSVRLGRI